MGFDIGRDAESEEEMTFDLNTIRAVLVTLRGRKVENSESHYRNSLHCSRRHGGSFRRSAVSRT